MVEVIKGKHEHIHTACSAKMLKTMPAWCTNTESQAEIWTRSMVHILHRLCGHYLPKHIPMLNDTHLGLSFLLPMHESCGVKSSFWQYPPLAGMQCPLVLGVLNLLPCVVFLPVLHSHSCLEPLLYKSKKSVRRDGQRERVGGGELKLQQSNKMKLVHIERRRRREKGRRGKERRKKGRKEGKELKQGDGERGQDKRYIPSPVVRAKSHFP